MAFIHLHNHSQYSMLDGACRIDKMVEKAKKYGMNAVAVTDHGNMFGTVDFCNRAKDAGIKPIVGMEAYIVNRDLDHPDSKKDTRHHLILLVMNDEGYHNLMKLSSYSYKDGFYYKPRISKSLLKKYSGGLICLSACIQGEIPRLLLSDRKQEAKEAVEWFKNTFPDNYYLEIMDHGFPDEAKARKMLIELARETDTPLVATNDCHYLNKEDAEAHDILLCIQTGKSVSDPSRMRFDSRELYFKTEEEMRKLFSDVPDALDNTQLIADKVNFELNYSEFLLPKIDIPSEFKDMGEYLRTLCYKNVPAKYGNLTDKIKERIDFELDVIHRMGYDGYFLVVKDFIDAARDRDIPVGPGRGSAAGSIVAFLLDITRLDPLKYGLLFERFLDLKRVGMPDIDIDFCAEGRAKVIDYVIQKYGRESVTQIITFGTLGPKSVIKDVCRTLDIPPSESNNITKLMPSGPTVTLESALEDSKEFRNLMNGSELYKTVLKHSLVLEGLVRQTGIHAAGVVIGPGDLSDYVPLAAQQKEGQQAVLVQYEGKWLDDLKLLKMDFLGLKTLTVIKRTLQLLKKSQGIDIDIDNVDLTDKKSYELLSAGQTDGIFQFESGGMKKYLKELKPNMFDDLIAMVALYRPGPMQFINTYIKRKHGVEEIKYAHELTRDALEETYGVTVYQEQVMLIAKKMAGFSSAEAGALRKAISKKKKALMDEMGEKFINGAVKNGVDRVICTNIWEDWQEFANYAFNKSHAACYAYVAFQTAYLKAHFPVEFMAAILSLENDPQKIPYFMEECKNMGIEIVPPNVNLSEKEFTVENGKILFGMRGIKNVGSVAIPAIIKEREANGKFTELVEFTKRLDSMIVNKAVIESLISSGAMDDLKGNRAQKYALVQSAIEYSSGLAGEKKKGQLLLFDMLSDNGEDSGAGEDMFQPQLPDIPEWGLKKMLEMEKDILGFYMSGHPLMNHKMILNCFCNYDTEKFAEKVKTPGKIKIAGIVTSVTRKTGRNGKPFAFVALEDLYSKFEVSLFSQDYEKYYHLMREGIEVLVIGKKGKNFNGDESVLKIMPQEIIPFESLRKTAKGDVYITLDGKKVNKELGQNIKNMSLSAPGNFKVHFLVKTENFKTIQIHPADCNVFPGTNAFSFLQDCMIGNPTVKAKEYAN